MPDYQQALDRLDNPPARTPEPTVSQDETLSGSMVGETVSTPPEQPEETEEKTDLDFANDILALSEDELKQRIYQQKHYELQQNAPPTSESMWKAQQRAALSYAHGEGYHQWIAWAEAVQMEPETALQALSWGNPTDDDVGFIHWQEGEESESQFDIFVAETVSETERNLGPEAADQMFEHFQTNRDQWLQSPQWMLLDEEQKGFLTGLAHEVHSSVWSNAERYNPPEGMMKRVFDIALGVAGLDPVMPETGTGGMIGFGVDAALLISSIGQTLGLKSFARAFDDEAVASWGMLKKSTGAAGRVATQYGDRYIAAPATLLDIGRNVYGIIRPPGSPLQPGQFYYPGEAQFNSGQTNYLYGRERITRPTGPREGFIPFLSSDLAGWKSPFWNSMRSVDIQRSRDLWREVDGVGSHMTYFTPFPGDVDEQSLNLSREKAWDYIDSLRLGAETEDVFINEIVDLDQALQSRVAYFFKKANDEMSLLAGMQYAIAEMSNPRTSSNVIVSHLQSFIPNEKLQDFVRANEAGSYGVGGARTGTSELEMFIDIVRERPETLQESKDEYATFVMAAHSLQEVQRMLGAYLSHYQKSGTGRFDQHVGSYHTITNGEQVLFEWEELLNPAMQAPGAGFHDGWVAPGQRSIASDWAYDTGAAMPGSVEDDRVENVNGAPRFVADAYTKGRNARRTLEGPLAEIQMEARASGDHQYGHVASLIYTKFQNDYLPTFQNDYWRYDPDEGGNSVAWLGYNKTPPNDMRPWQEGVHHRVPEAESWGMIVGVNEEIVEIYDEAAKLSPTQRKTIADGLKEAIAVAELRRDSLNAQVSVQYSGATRSLSEMYRNAYGSDAQTLRVLLKAVEGTR